MIPKRQIRGPLTVQILTALDHSPCTIYDLTLITGRSQHQIHGMISHLTRSGQVVRGHWLIASSGPRYRLYSRSPRLSEDPEGRTPSSSSPASASRGRGSATTPGAPV